MGAHTDQIRAENHSLLKLVPAHRASVPWAWPVPSCQTSLLGWPSRDNLWGQWCRFLGVCTSGCTSCQCHCNRFFVITSSPLTGIRQTSSIKGQTMNGFLSAICMALWPLDSVLCITGQPPKQCVSEQAWLCQENYLHKWVWLHSIKTLFTKTNSRLDFANGPGFSDSFSKVSVQQYIWQSLRNGRIYFRWPFYLLLWERIT